MYLDWCGEGNPDTGPVVIILPGITGGLGGSHWWGVTEEW